jgi:hypothetical protein
MQVSVVRLHEFVLAESEERFQAYFDVGRDCLLQHSLLQPAEDPKLLQISPNRVPETDLLQ